MDHLHAGDGPMRSSNASLELTRSAGAFGALRSALFWAFVVSGFLNLLYFAPSLFMMQIYDRVLPTGGLATLAALSTAALAAVVMIGVLDWVRGRMMQHAAREYEARLTGLAAAAQLHEATGHPADQPPPLRALEAVRGAVSGQHFLPLMDAPWTPLFICAAALIHPLIAALILAGVALALVPAFFQGRGQATESGSLMLGAQEHEWTRHDVVRALGMGQGLAARYERARLITRSTHAETGGLFASLSRAMRIGLQMAVLATGAVLAIEKQISPGALIAVSIMSSRALGPVEQLAHAWRPAMAGLKAMRTLKVTLGRNASRTPRTQLPNPSGRLDFEAVAIAATAGERPLLHQVTFSVAPGQAIGVIGGSGTGKSSLARAAAGVLTATEGVIRIDGTDITSWDDAWLGRHTGYLPQDIALFSGTIADNISRFEEVDPRTRTQLVVEAAQAAGVHDLISRLPQGYDTVLGMGGRGLSHGQAQRVALARALYRMPALLILDEPNAHLDDQGEAALIRAIEAAKARGAAVIVIAHRMSVMRVADRLLAIRDGRIVDVPREALAPRRVVFGGNRTGSQSAGSQ